mmetsp:Transcript_3854/g.8691  ORF Transcript_3854/g.8691 Transcript_3854/m.8691 type:complete len:247 (+) Transcript_3854:91-831(+)
MPLHIFNESNTIIHKKNRTKKQGGGGGTTPIIPITIPISIPITITITMPTSTTPMTPVIILTTTPSILLEDDEVLRGSLPLELQLSQQQWDRLLLFLVPVPFLWPGRRCHRHRHCHRRCRWLHGRIRIRIRNNSHRHRRCRCLETKLQRQRRRIIGKKPSLQKRQQKQQPRTAITTAIMTTTTMTMTFWLACLEAVKNATIFLPTTLARTSCTFEGPPVETTYGTSIFRALLVMIARVPPIPLLPK